MRKIIFIFLTYFLNFEVRGSWFIIPEDTTTGIRRLQFQSALNDDLKSAAVAPESSFMTNMSSALKDLQDISDLVWKETMARMLLESSEVTERITHGFFNNIEFSFIGDVHNDHIDSKDARG